MIRRSGTVRATKRIRSCRKFFNVSNRLEISNVFTLRLFRRAKSVLEKNVFNGEFIEKKLTIKISIYCISVREYRQLSRFIQSDYSGERVNKVSLTSGKIRYFESVKNSIYFIDTRASNNSTIKILSRDVTLANVSIAELWVGGETHRRTKKHLSPV